MVDLLNPLSCAGEILENKRRIKRGLLEGHDDFVEKRIAILSGSTIGEFADILEIFLLNNGIKPVFWKGNYNRFYEDVVFNPDALLEFAPDVVYIHTSCRNILAFPEVGDSYELVQKKLDMEMERFEAVWEVLREKTVAVIIQNNFELLPYRALGNCEVYRQDGMLRYINLLNEKIYDYATKHSDFFVNDISYQASVYGLQRWFDNSMWYAYKYPFALEAIPLVAFNLSNIIKSVYGKNKRSLVLDLDNTLWGGVIGDCGLEGIRIGNETPEGMAYTEFQNYIKRISKVGVSLSVCSKNDETLALEGFEHPGCILTKEDFVCKYINWNSKDLNIEEIQKGLNISFGSMVFVDDNPAERDVVNRAFPQIGIPSMNEPESYIQTLDAPGFFEVTTVSEDDLKRNNYYKNNFERLNEKKKHDSFEEYLRSLGMICNIIKVNSENIERVTQLVNKTNQFNLTSKRYTINELRNFMENDDYIFLCVKLRDKYGDNGIVSVLLVNIENEKAVIELWVMSCRVFERRLELAVFSELLKICTNKGVKVMEGIYLSTERNKYVQSLYEDLGFCKIEQAESKSTWRLDMQSWDLEIEDVMEVITNEYI